MSLKSRSEYLAMMSLRYLATKDRAGKTQIIDEVVASLGYNRKYAIRILRHPRPRVRPVRRRRSYQYRDALPIVAVVWESLDYCCAERLHPVLLAMARLLAEHGEVALTDEVCRQLGAISRPTLARRLAELPSPKVRHRVQYAPSPALRSEVPMGRFRWDEQRPGALEVDLVEHNGGSSGGHFAYTIDVVDIVTGWSRRRAVLGRGQIGVFRELQALIESWPYRVWALHSDNGSEFLSNQLVRFCRECGLEFTRSRPYRKNDSAHVEQRNSQFVRGYVGYGRHETPEDTTWLNQVYAQLDVYANLFLPTRKLIWKERRGAHIHKTYDIARTPYLRALELNVLSDRDRIALADQYHKLNPLALQRAVQTLLDRGSQATVKTAAN